MPKLFGSAPVYLADLSRMRTYCQEHGLKLSWACSRAMTEYLDKMEAAMEAADNAEPKIEPDAQ